MGRVRGDATPWELRSTDSGVNVLLAEPESDTVFARSLTTTSGLVVATPSQVAADTTTSVTLDCLSSSRRTANRRRSAPRRPKTRLSAASR
jgi:hypothetical protein